MESDASFPLGYTTLFIRKLEITRYEGPRTGVELLEIGSMTPVHEIGVWRAL